MPGLQTYHCAWFVQGFGSNWGDCPCYQPHHTPDGSLGAVTKLCAFPHGCTLSVGFILLVLTVLIKDNSEILKEKSWFFFFFSTRPLWGWPQTHRDLFVCLCLLRAYPVIKALSLKFLKSKNSPEDSPKRLKSQFLFWRDRMSKVWFSRGGWFGFWQAVWAAEVFFQPFVDFSIRAGGTNLKSLQKNLHLMWCIQCFQR